MQTVTADAINSRNKQKSSQLERNSSRKFQESQKYRQTQLMHQVQSKKDNIGETS